MSIKQMIAWVVLVLSAVLLLSQVFTLKPTWEFIALAVVAFTVSAIYIWGDVDEYHE